MASDTAATAVTTGLTGTTGATPGRLLRPGDAGYDALRSGFNVAVSHRPAPSSMRPASTTWSRRSGWRSAPVVRWR